MPLEDSWERRHKKHHQLCFCEGDDAHLHDGFCISLQSLLLVVPGSLLCCINLSAWSRNDFPSMIQAKCWRRPHSEKLGGDFDPACTSLLQHSRSELSNRTCPTPHGGYRALEIWLMWSRVFTCLSGHKSFVWWHPSAWAVPRTHSSPTPSFFVLALRNPSTVSTHLLKLVHSKILKLHCAWEFTWRSW